MPRFVEMERRYGSVVKGLRAAEQTRKSAEISGARWSLFQSFKNGTATLPETLVARLGGLICQTAGGVAPSRKGQPRQLPVPRGGFLDAAAAIFAAPRCS